MNRRGTTIALVGGALVVVGLCCVAWRRQQQLGEFSDAVARGEVNRADALADGFFEAGNLRRDLAVLSAILVVCLAAALLVSRDGGEAGGVIEAAKPETFGFGSYL